MVTSIPFASIYIDVVGSTDHFTERSVLVQAQQTATEVSDVSEQHRTKQVRMAVTKRIKELGRAKKV